MLQELLTWLMGFLRRKPERVDDLIGGYKGLLGKWQVLLKPLEDRIQECEEDRAALHRKIEECNEDRVELRAKIVQLEYRMEDVEYKTNGQ
jgi:chromosome segregation ATPase